MYLEKRMVYTEAFQFTATALAACIHILSICDPDSIAL